MNRTGVGGDDYNSIYNWLPGPSTIRRDKVEVTLHGGLLDACLPLYGKCYALNAPLGNQTWLSNVKVILGHHSYNPTKEHPDQDGPNTWHWDNITIDVA